MIDKVDIPIPKAIGATVGPAILIQRYGAILFRAFTCSLAQEGFRSKVFVHDSLLLEIPNDQHVERSIYEIRVLLDSIRRSKGIRAMNIKLGTGDNWGAAEDLAELVSLCD